MASLKEMRDQIKSVESTQKITRAMQMVAAAKLRRATDAAQNARPYAQRMATVIANLAAGVSGDGAPKLLVGTGRQDRHLVVVTSSDRGLAGGFNSSIIRAARDRVNSLLAEGKDVKIITVGKKARDQFRRVFGDRFVATFEAGVPGLASAQPVADKITELFETGQVDVVTLAFSRYKSVVVQTPTLTQLVGVGFFVVGLSACAGSSSSSTTTTTTTTTPVTQSEISLPSSVQVVSAN